MRVGGKGGRGGESDSFAAHCIAATVQVLRLTAQKFKSQMTGSLAELLEEHVSDKPIPTHPDDDCTLVGETRVVTETHNQTKPASPA